MGGQRYRWQLDHWATLWHKSHSSLSDHNYVEDALRLEINSRTMMSTYLTLWIRHVSVSVIKQYKQSTGLTFSNLACKRNLQEIHNFWTDGSRSTGYELDLSSQDRLNLWANVIIRIHKPGFFLSTLRKTSLSQSAWVTSPVVFSLSSLAWIALLNNFPLIPGTLPPVMAAW